MTESADQNSLVPPLVRDALMASGLWEDLVASGVFARLEPSTLAAMQMIGAWSDLDWDEMQAGLAHLRHESVPTPPITSL